MSTIERKEYNALPESEVNRLTEKFNISILTIGFEFPDSLPETVISNSFQIQREIYGTEITEYKLGKAYPYLYFQDKTRNVLCEALLLSDEQITEPEIEKTIIKLMELPVAVYKLF